MVRLSPVSGVVSICSARLDHRDMRLGEGRLALVLLAVLLRLEHEHLDCEVGVLVHLAHSDRCVAFRPLS
jgi:hypothetical protein